MKTYVVLRKSDGQEIYRYVADAPIEWSGMEFLDHDHIEAADPPVELTVTPVASRRVSKLQFQELLGDTTYLQIKAAAQEFPAVGLWLDKFNMLSTDADGTSVDLSDPRTRAGLEALIGVPGIDMTQEKVNMVLGVLNG